ncbi:hypothetical protein C0J52_03715 [Blattella germanica]|nr:hypothetical protein C0J52_03715 [Blattella germanica]
MMKVEIKMESLFSELWWMSMVFSVTTAVLLYLYLTWTHNYWSKRGVPYLKPKLIFGSLKDHIIGKKTLGQVYQDCYRELEGHPFGGIFKFRQPVVLLRDPELMKNVLVKEFASFQDNDFHSNVDVDPLWKEQRSKLTPAFTTGKLKPVFPLIEEVCNDLMEHLRENAKMDEDIAAQALTFFTDGYETSSTALTTLLHGLAINQTAQARLREEVDAALASNGGKMNLDMIQSMEYVDMALKEALRMYPVLPYMNRLCTKPFELPLSDGKTVTVEVGTPVVTPILGIHYDPEYFPEPEKYEPERFTEENKAKRPKYIHFPFGEGPRICLGMKFAQAQIKACVTSILSEFEIKPTDETPKLLTPVPTAFMIPLQK